MGDIPALESPTDDYTESVCIKSFDAGRGFYDAAGDKVGIPPGQLGRGEVVGEDEVVQTRDTAESIQGDGTSLRNVSPKWESYGSSPLLALFNMTLASSRAEHLGDGVCSNGGKAFCDGADAEIPDGLLHTRCPIIVGSLLNGDVGMFIEHFVDGDEVNIIVWAAAGVSKVRSALRVAIEKPCVPDPLVEEVDPILGHVLETVQDLHGVPGSVIVDAGQVPPQWGERVSHRYRALGEKC